MLGFLKMSAVSAVLSFSVVTAYNGGVPASAAQPSLKPFQERLAAAEPEGAVLHVTGSTARGSRLDRPAACADEAWPHISPACTTGPDGRPLRRSVRLVTSERREGENTSILIRHQPSDVAAR
ncbi:MAG TPA: hypothetical protein VIL09_06450 [Microvirga sp.]|jgi:hypothetical protein